jgi:uncharacterized membrane protein HdeD (DUF308 family)
MNQNIVIDKWRLLYFQGFLFLILSYSHFSNAIISIETVSDLTVFSALLTGVISIIGFFIEGLEGKNIAELVLGFFSCGLGMLIICSLFFAQEFIINILIALMLLNALQLIGNTIPLKAEISWWWISILFFIYTISISILIKIENMKDIILILVGVQFILNGLLLLLVAFFLRKLQLEFSKTIEQLKE